MTWAASRKWGGCSGRATIYAIANHANDLFFCWARQETLADESEQSIDSIGRRIADFISLGEVRRIKLKRFGRRTHDFLVLKPSPYFAAAIEEIEPFLPRDCDVMSDVAPDCASPERETGDAVSVPPPGNANADAAANCGSVAGAETRPTLPQPAVHATALVRQQEPILEPKKENPPNPLSPQGEPAGSAKESREARKPHAEPAEPPLFAAAFLAYPLHTLDNRKRAAEEFAKLPAADQDLVARIVGLFRRDIEAAKRKPPAMWKWLRDQRFAEYGQGGANAPRVFVTEGSEPWRAWTGVCRVAFGGAMPSFWTAPGPRGERGAMVRALWPVGGEGWLAPLDRWVFVEAGTPQYRRWQERIHEILQRAAMTKRATDADRARVLFARDGAAWGARIFEGLLVPSEWPPARGGPERAPASAGEDDLNELGREMGL